MSKAAKMSIAILSILLIAAFVFAYWNFLQKESVERAKLAVEKQVEDFQNREKNYIVEKKQIEEKLKIIEAEKAELENRLNSFDKDMVSLNDKLKVVTKERNEWQKRVENLQKERDNLLVKIQEQSEPQVVYKYIERGAEEGGDHVGQETVKSDSAPMENSVRPDDESYWAQILKKKAELELEVERLSGEMSRNSVEVEDLKKKNSDLQLELSHLSREKEEIERKIKHGNDLADSLALELARAQNDIKFVDDRRLKLHDENISLREQIKELTSTKIALEKSIVQIQEERQDIAKKLRETEGVIQSRIDEIWEIKGNLEKTFKPSGTITDNNDRVDLPPIIIDAGDREPSAGVVSPDLSVNNEIVSSLTPGGSIVSVNEENNFVIIDVGGEGGVKLGDTLSVYRGTDYIAGLEVIQVRKDIAAADIKNRVSNLKIGDSVR
jgi:predicted  nucleic acid-binding Zn-ribbon protein